MRNMVCAGKKCFRVDIVILAILFLNACSGGDSLTAPEITSDNTVTFAEGEAGTFTVTATGTPTPALSVSGSLPSGVTFDSSSGVLSGTPATGTFAAYPLTITARNGFASTATQAFTLKVKKTIDLVVNGSFESVLASWSQGTVTEPGATGTCSYNGDVAPGTETLTSIAGFPATDGTQIALGSVLSTSGLANRISCTLYQDIAIPAGTTSLVLTYDAAAKAGNDGCLSTGGFFGIYSISSIPAILDPPVVGTTGQLCTSGDESTLQSYTQTMTSVASVAGTTVRLGIINAAFMTGHEVIGIDNVKLMATVVP